MDLMFWFLMGGVVGFIMPFLLEATSDAFDSILEVLKWKFRKHQLVNLGAEGWFRAGDVKAIGIVKIDNGLFRVIILFDNWSIPTFYESSNYEEARKLANRVKQALEGDVAASYYLEAWYLEKLGKEKAEELRRSEGRQPTSSS